MTSLTKAWPLFTGVGPPSSTAAPDDNATPNDWRPSPFDNRWVTGDSASVSEEQAWTVLAARARDRWNQENLF